MFIVILLLIVVAFVYLKFVRDPKIIRELCAGKTKDQKDVIRYFLVDGCLRRALSDAEYDALVARSIPDLKQRAMDKIGLDEDQLKEIEPVHFEGYAFDDDTYQKAGKDNVWRSSKYEISWLFFSDTQVYLYKKTISFDELKEKEHTEEYFYKDITNFSTVSETKEITDYTNKDKKGNPHKIKIDTNMFKLTVPGDSFLCAMAQNEYTENAIQGMKAKLREKKQA